MGLKQEMRKNAEKGQNTEGCRCQGRLCGDGALELGWRVGKSISSRGNSTSCFATCSGFHRPERRMVAGPVTGDVRQRQNFNRKGMMPFTKRHKGH